MPPRQMTGGDVAEHALRGGDISGSTATTTAIRLGWALAEARGRNWPQGPRPSASVLPLHPASVLPLRSQRPASASRRESAAALISLVRALDLDPDGTFQAELAAALPPLDPAGDATLVEEAALEEGSAWRRTAGFFLTWDGRIQDELTRRSEALANGYLLGRGLAECYWGLGHERSWAVDGSVSAVSLAYLFGDDRHRELTRMLGRLQPGVTHEMSGAVIAGTLEAWADVARDEAWSRVPDLRDRLYEQVRRWYQLLMLDQDPTTMIRPYEKLSGLRGAGRALRLFWPQALLAVVAICLVTAFLARFDGTAPGFVSSLLATSGISALAVAGLLARTQSAAQRLVTRLRQDAYTDLVAVSVTVLPDPPGGTGAQSLSRAREQLESAVRRRLLTPPTPPPS